MNLLPMALFAALLPTADTQYKDPPAPIPGILDASPAPAVRVSPDQKWLLVMERPALPPISEVGAPELRLAGIRINPRTYARSRDGFLTGVKLVPVTASAQGTTTPKAMTVPIPEGRRIAQVVFSPDSMSLALILEGSDGLELAIADVATATTGKVSATGLSGVLTSPCSWSASVALVCLKRADGQPPSGVHTPSGPAIQETRVGSAPNPTYQDMASHYGVAVLPTRVRRPRDKGKVEAGVLVVERWILAALRHRRFFSLAELNAALRELLFTPDPPRVRER